MMQVLFGVVVGAVGYKYGWPYVVAGWNWVKGKVMPTPPAPPAGPSA